jgi:RHS repeat-associated protein
MVTNTQYNQFGQITQINLGNNLINTYGYYGTGGAYDTTGTGYYGKLYEIKTFQQGQTPVQDVQHAWDAAGNLVQRTDVVQNQIEQFGYDFLDRLTSVSGPYSQTYTYNQIGNITSMNGTSYSYGSRPHAVTAVGSASYTYDANGNMTNRNGQSITWNIENQVAAVGSSTFIYDAGGSRVKKTENGQTVIYVNKYYEKNITTGEVTTYYYLGGKMVAQRKNTTLQYMHQDHLTGTSLVTNADGSQNSAIKYLPFGATLSGSVPTDIKFTGQRLDSTGLYYYGARYYDATIGRFISPDPTISHPANSQAFNRYSYCINNPLKYIDPSGLKEEDWYDPFWDKDPPPDYSPPSSYGFWLFSAGSNQMPPKPGEEPSQDYLNLLNWVNGQIAKSPYESNSWTIIHGRPMANDGHSFNDQVQEIIDFLKYTDHKDINIRGFSQGASAVSQALYNIAQAYLSGKPIIPYTDLCRKTGSIQLIEPYTKPLWTGWDPNSLNYLPYYVDKYISPNISMLNIYNEKSWIQGKKLDGWGENRTLVLNISNDTHGACIKPENLVTDKLK